MELGWKKDVSQIIITGLDFLSFYYDYLQGLHELHMNDIT